MKNTARAAKKLGIGIVMDDFGTGFSSLRYLQQFPFDKVKIDRSFVSNVSQDQSSVAIVCAVNALARGLNMVTVAEGVETPEQHRFLQAVGCHQLQGYLFSKPVPAHMIDEMLGLGPLERLFRDPSVTEVMVVGYLSSTYRDAIAFGILILAGIWPLRTWSPDGHASAPTAVSMLHAGVLMKLLFLKQLGWVDVVLLTLPGETVVHTGHGDDTTIAADRAFGAGA